MVGRLVAVIATGVVVAGVVVATSGAVAAAHGDEEGFLRVEY